MTSPAYLLRVFAGLIALVGLMATLPGLRSTPRRTLRRSLCLGVVDWFALPLLCKAIALARSCQRRSCRLRHNTFTSAIFGKPPLSTRRRLESNLPLANWRSGRRIPRVMAILHADDRPDLGLSGGVRMIQIFPATHLALHPLVQRLEALLYRSGLG